MQLKLVVICLSAAAAVVQAAALPLTNLNVRGNVPDETILERDVIPESSVPHPSTLSARQTSLITATDNLLFTSTLDQFLTAKANKQPAGLDWTDNGCSNSPDKPLGFNFLYSCMRHDFGYRNYKAQSRFTEPNRKKIDDKFKADLYNECKKQGTLAEIACKALADTYYVAVRAFGGLYEAYAD
ncbi:prokaryotic phospholipase A2-domain-containing protein [Kalaharituber pfeilii]|nr:prokaryotic phospholipase A2-domain-containing protein [Kalaharituber pfeilii]